MRKVVIFVLLAAVFCCVAGCKKDKDDPPPPQEPQSPWVMVTTPDSPASGDITIIFQLIDIELESCDVTIEYSIDAGQTFHPATLTAASQTMGLASDWYPGVMHAVHWDSVTDMVGISGAVEVVVKITPSDASNPSGTPDTTDSFTVNTPLVSYAVPSGRTWPNARLDVGDVEVTFSTNYDGAVIHFTSGTNPTTPITSSPVFDPVDPIIINASYKDSTFIIKYFAWWQNPVTLEIVQEDPFNTEYYSFGP